MRDQKGKCEAKGAGEPNVGGWLDGHARNRVEEQIKRVKVIVIQTDLGQSGSMERRGRGQMPDSPPCTLPYFACF